MFRIILFLIALSSWAEGSEVLVGGDLPTDTTLVRITTNLSHETPATPASLSEDVDPWDSFMGSFRIGIEQSPLTEFYSVSRNTSLNYRAPFIFLLTPFEPANIFHSTKSKDLSALREIYSFNIGFGIRGESSIAIEQFLQVPVFRSNRSQCNFGGYLSTYYFRKGNPYWSTGLMGYAGYLISSNAMIRIGMKHNVFDYLAKESQYRDIQYIVKPNNWRMFISLSLGSI